MSEPSSAPSASRPEPLSLVWRFFAAPPTLLILIALLAVVLIVSQIVPQIPPEIDDPRAWLAGQPGVLGGGSALLQALGLFDLTHAPWFRLLLALTGLSLFVWAVESAEIAWRASSGRWTGAALVLWGRHPLQVRLPSPRSPGEAQAELHAFLGRHRYRWSEVAGSPGPNVVASRHTLGWWAQPVTFAGLLLALLGLAGVATWGWQGKEWRPASGERWVVGHNTDTTIQLDAFDSTASGNVPGLGAADDYESRVTWLENDQPVHQARVAVDQPTTWHGLTLRQVGTAPAVTVRGTDPAGQVLLFQSADEVASPAEEITIAFESPGSQHLVLLPNQNVFLLLSLEPDAPAGTGGAAEGGQPALRVAQLSGADLEQETLGVLHESGTVQVQGLRVQLDLAFRPVLRVDHQPGMGLVVGGLALAVLALAAGWLASPALLWLAIAPGIDCPTLVQVLGLGGTGQVPWFARLVGQLREALADGD